MPSNSIMSRRSFLLDVGIFAVVSLMSRPTHSAQQSLGELAIKEIRDLLEGDPAFANLCRSCHISLAERTNYTSGSNSLLGRFASVLDKVTNTEDRVAQIQKSFITFVELDFEAGHVVEVEGWVLPTAEVEVYALLDHVLQSSSSM